jgi:hypothetical protein
LYSTFILRMLFYAVEIVKDSDGSETDQEHLGFREDMLDI